MKCHKCQSDSDNNYTPKKINIDSTHKIIDPFAGSGGFLLQAKKRFKLESDNIYAQEYDDKIYKFLKFNSMISNLNKDNISKGDSYDYHDFLSDKQGFFDRIVTNPPFGESIDIMLSDTERSAFWKLMKTGKSISGHTMTINTLVQKERKNLESWSIEILKKVFNIKNLKQPELFKE